MSSPINIQNQIQCKICNTTLKSPVQLPCHHTYCIECIARMKTDDETIECPSCGKSCTKVQCIHDADKQKLIDIFENSTAGASSPKEAGGKMKKFHLPSRGGSKKLTITKDKTNKSKAFSIKSISMDSGSSQYDEIPTTTGKNSKLNAPNEKAALLIKKSIRQSLTGSSSSTDSDREKCPICIKNNCKLICIKCSNKSCDACSVQFPLRCRDDTEDHIFIEEEDNTSQEDSSKKSLNLLPENSTKLDNTSDNPNIPIATPKKKVTFPVDESNESSTDPIFKPKFRDSIAMTKDKKLQLQGIMAEVSKIEDIGLQQVEALQGYHQYMKDVKVAGFKLIDITEKQMNEKVAEFFQRIKSEYESGFDEMTDSSKEIQGKLEKDLEKIQCNSNVLEEIVDNNDTRVMMDGSFLTEKCEELDDNVKKLGEHILQCKQSGLSVSKEWNHDEKSTFEKQMSLHILKATESEINNTLLPNMTGVINDLKPIIKEEEQQISTSKKVGKQFECVIC